MAEAAFDVFLSYSWPDMGEVAQLEAALHDRGLRVFRDSSIQLGVALSESFTRALASSTVLVAYYSMRYSVRYACQWELTSAVLAARRLGDVRARVLVLNPEEDDRHIAPVELAGEGGVRWRPGEPVDIVVEWIAAKVAAAERIPLGSAKTPHQQSDAPIAVPSASVGRYPDMWAIHRGLHDGQPYGAGPRRHGPVVVLHGAPGMGKTSTAAQYASTFAHAYPGGVVWTDLGGGHQVSDRSLLSDYGLQVAGLAEARFGLPVAGLEPDRVCVVLADHIDRAGEDVLWVVDDLPEGLDIAVVDRLTIPAARVHTVFTARTVPAEWSVPRVALEGLTELEAESLAEDHWPEMDVHDKHAVAVLTRRCAGHPLVLTAAVPALRTGVVAPLVDGLDDIAADVDTALTPAVRASSHPARLVLAMATVLEQAPVSSDFVKAVLEPLLGHEHDLADALDELAEASLISRTHRTAATWQVHALVRDFTRRHTDAALLIQLARGAAAELMARIGGTEAPSDLHRHAMWIARNPAIPADIRRGLLRAVTAVYDRHGDVLAAHAVAAEAVDDASDRQSADWIADMLTTAQLAIDAGALDDALERTRQIIEGTADHRAEYRARLLAATAHDLRGQYTAADLVFHRHANVLAEGPVPTWMSDEEQMRLRIAQITARRLRGHYSAAYDAIAALLPEIRRKHQGGMAGGPWPLALLELARLQLLTNRIGEAREAARQVREIFARESKTHHRLHRDAVEIGAQADLALTFTERAATGEPWRAAVGRIGELVANSRNWYGADNLHTLSLLVTHGRSLVMAGMPAEALQVLTEAEPRIDAVLGSTHPLGHLARFTASRAHLSLGETRRGRDILAELLPQQVAAIGPAHPDALITRFELGVAHMLTGERIVGKRMIREAGEALRRELGWQHEDALRATIAERLLPLPTAVWRAAARLNRTTKRGDHQIETTTAATAATEQSVHAQALAGLAPHLYSDYLTEALAATLTVTDDAVRADMAREVLKECRALLGDYHPQTLAARLTVAADLAAAGKYAEALIMDEATLRDARRVLGENHPDTLLAAMHVAAGYAATDRPTEAAALGQDTLRRYRQVLGDDHPATRLCAENVAGIR